MSSEESETPSVHTEPGFPDDREAWGPGRVAARNPLVPAFREWWKHNPLSVLRASGKANLWRRFEAEVVEGKSPLEAAQGPYTTTLEDLARCASCRRCARARVLRCVCAPPPPPAAVLPPFCRRRRFLCCGVRSGTVAAADAAACCRRCGAQKQCLISNHPFSLLPPSVHNTTHSPPMPADLAAGGGDDVPSDELWWGTPDPAVYAPGTATLSRQQIAEEAAKGNVVTLRAFREALEGAEDWEIDVRELFFTVLGVLVKRAARPPPCLCLPLSICTLDFAPLANMTCLPPPLQRRRCATSCCCTGCAPR